jgi:hypothetical protein
VARATCSIFKLLVAGFPPRRPGFEPGSGHVGFVVDKVALGQVFSEYFGFPCQSSFHQLLHNHPHLSPGACTIGQKWPQNLVDLVPSHQKNLLDLTRNFIKKEKLQTYSILLPSYLLSTLAFKMGKK